MAVLIDLDHSEIQPITERPRFARARKVDMTAEMIEKARASKAKLGVDNVEFRLGEIEHLPVADSTLDVVISNCVINLSPDKSQVFRETYRALRPGGRLSVSDIVTEGPLPEVIKNDSSAGSSCVAGALEVKDYVAAIEDAGFIDIELAPVNLDEDLYDEVLGLSRTESIAVSERGAHLAAVNLKGGVMTSIDLGDEQRVILGTSRPPIFSAKVSARNPSKTS